MLTKSSLSLKFGLATTGLEKRVSVALPLLAGADSKIFRIWVALPISFESFFNGFSGQPGQQRRRGPMRGDDLRLNLKLDFKEAVFGGEKEIRISHLETCNTCTGSGAKPGTRPRTCSTCNGAGQVRRATRTPFGIFNQVSACPTCNGSGEVVEDRCETCGW